MTYRLAKTTLEEALQYWQESDATILAHGNLAVGAGSGSDNRGLAFDKDVDLIDVKDIEFEGLNTARFMFYKGVLYGIQVRLQEGLFKENQSLNVSAEALDAFRKGLMKKYGNPNESLRSFFSSGKKPDILIWHLMENRLIFTVNDARASLAFINKKIEKAVEQNRKEVCKRFNTKDRRICW